MPATIDAPPAIDRPLREGDVIEVVFHNEHGAPRERLHIRRVRVTNLRTRGNTVTFTGVNLQGKYPNPYELPAKPLEEAKREGEYRGWLRSPLTEEDE